MVLLNCSTADRISKDDFFHTEFKSQSYKIFFSLHAVEDTRTLRKKSRVYFVLERIEIYYLFDLNYGSSCLAKTTTVSGHEMNT